VEKKEAPKKADLLKKVSESKVPKGMIETKEGLYVCKKKCYFGIRLYNVGSTYEAVKGEFIPNHFEKAKRMVAVDD